MLAGRKAMCSWPSQGFATVVARQIPFQHLGLLRACTCTLSQTFWISADLQGSDCAARSLRRHYTVHVPRNSSL